MKAATIASERGVPGPVAMQLEYSLVARDVESEHLPAAREARMGVVPWSPLAGGFLSGKYAREAANGAGRLSGANPFGDTKFSERNWQILSVLTKVAAEIGRTPAEVALAWVMGRPGVDATIVGASRLVQLDGHIAAASLSLGEGHRKRLDDASAPIVGFTAGLATPMIRRMVFGGREVRAWGE